MINEANCNVIKDILPLYADNVVSNDTKSFVENHIAKCDICKNELAIYNEELKKESINHTAKEDIALIEIFGQSFKRKKLISSIISSSIIALILITAFYHLTTPTFIPYSLASNSLSVQDNDGLISLTFEGEYELIKTMEGSYSFSIFNTILNDLLGNPNHKTIIINPNYEAVTELYYDSNGQEANEIIYGNSIEDGTSVTLPRLSLNFYFMLSVFAFIFLALTALFLKRVHKTQLIVTKFALLPASYAVSNVILGGLGWSTYSPIHDLLFYCLLSIPICLLLWCWADVILKNRKHN